jgi:MFS family permease
MASNPPTSGSRGHGATLYKKGMFESLRIRDFRILWLSNLATSFAMMMQMVARGWLIYDMTNSPLALTWVMLSFLLPSFVFSLAGGVIADRLHKKSIMITSQVLNTIATVFLASIIYSGDITFWHFIYFGLFNGTVLSFSMPARSAVIPEVVGKDSLVNAMALQSATFNLSRILGPALAGMLIALFAGGDTTSTYGVGIVFFMIAGLYALSVCAVSFLHYDGAPINRESASMLEDIAEGFRYMRDEKLILGLLIMGFVPMTFGFSASFLLPAFNKDIIHGGPDDLGLLMTGMGIGALCGSLLLAHLGDIGGKGRIMFTASYIWALTLAAFAMSNHLVLAMVIGAMSGLCGTVFGAMNMSIVQLAIQPEIRGRVMSIMMMTHGLMPIGIIPVSALAEYVGIDVALLFAAAMLALSMLLLGVWFPDLRRIDKGHGVDAVFDEGLDEGLEPPVVAAREPH